MRDDFLIPNLGQGPTQYDREYINRLVRNIEMTLTGLRAAGRNNVTSINYRPTTVAALPANGKAGDVAFVSDGRKNGEGAGVGTGVLVFHDGVAWRACDTGQTVSA